MKKHEMLLTAALLDWAHEVFINNTPGPIPDAIKNILTPDQWDDLSREYHQFLNEDYREPLEKGFDPDRPTASLYDDAALWVLSKKIKKEADMMSGNDLDDDYAAALRVLKKMPAPSEEWVADMEELINYCKNHSNEH